MILLDGIDKHDPPQPGKLVADSSSAPVARPHTPTPSLPDYEASQAQLKPTTQSFPEIQKQRTRRRRWKKCALYTLVVYFVVTVAIGVPLIVMVRPFPGIPSIATGIERLAEIQTQGCLQVKSIFPGVVAVLRHDFQKCDTRRRSLATIFC